MQQGINPGHPRLVGFAAARAVRDAHDNEMEVLASTTTNANVDYPHARHRCGVHPFVVAAAGGDPERCDSLNRRYCAKCYCTVCDVPAGECRHSRTGGGVPGHCHAHKGDAPEAQA